LRPTCFPRFPLEQRAQGEQFILQVIIIMAKTVFNKPYTRLWNRPLQIQPLLLRHPRFVWLINKTVSNNRLYYAFSMIIYLLNTVDPNHTFKQKLETLFQKYPNIDRSAMGFPVNWQNEPLWE